MKFVCVECDEAMKLTATRPPDAAGSLTVLFSCMTCGRGVAMLTNPWETELVSSLGVKIGPKEAGGAAAEAARAGQAAAGEQPGQQAAGCPFSGMVRQMEAAAGAAEPAGPQWTAEALARLDGIPEFVRPMAKQGVEHYAASNGCPVIDEKVLDEARSRFGM
jgi:hypothetical protein